MQNYRQLIGMIWRTGHTFPRTHHKDDLAPIDTGTLQHPVVLRLAVLKLLWLGAHPKERGIRTAGAHNL